MDRRELLRRAGLGGLAALISSGAYAIGPGGDGPEQPGQDGGNQPPETPPNPPGGPPPGGPGNPPAPGATIDLTPFTIMNVHNPARGILGQAPTKVFKIPRHTDGEAVCPDGFYKGMCEGGMAEGGRGKAVHQYVWSEEKRPSDAREGFEALLAFIKSPSNGGIELHHVYNDAIRIRAENTNWRRDENGIWRLFNDHIGQPGAIWVRRHVPHGKVFQEGGHQTFYDCRGNYVADYALDSAWMLLGPYAIDTTDGLAAARRDLAPFTPPGREVVPSAWLNMLDKIPELKRDFHCYLVSRPDGWSRIADSGYPNLADFRFTEKYDYFGIMPSPDMTGIFAGGWGAGMARWTFIDKVLGLFVRDTILHTPVKDNFLFWDGKGACVNYEPSPAFQGIGSSKIARMERGARYAYSMGQLGAPMSDLEMLGPRHMEELDRHDLDMMLELLRP